MRFPTMWYVRPTKAQTSLRICAVRSEPVLGALIFSTVKLLTEHHLEFLSFKRGCTGSSESTLVKIPHCWKSHVEAHLVMFFKQYILTLVMLYISCIIFIPNFISVYLQHSCCKHVGVFFNQREKHCRS